MSIFIVITIIALFASLVCGMLTIPVVLDFCKRKGLYDMPNLRKVHKRAVPRLGGVVFLPSVFLGCVIAFLMAQWQGMTSIQLSLWTFYFFLGTAAIYITGLIDDIVGLNAMNKLAVQVFAASAFPLSGLCLNDLYGIFGIHLMPWWVGALFTIAMVVFISNAINLIDGIDGLAGSLTILALTGFLLSFAHLGMWFFVILIAAMIGVILSYLYYNIYGDINKNRKIFMGDTGSLSIGFVLAFLCLKLTVAARDTSIVFSDRNILTAFSLIIIPVLDSFRVAGVRVWHGRLPILPDKNHIHHKLLRAGLTHHQTLLVILAQAVLFCLANYLMRQITSTTVVIIADITIYAISHLLLNRRIRRRGEQPIIF